MVLIANQYLIRMAIIFILLNSAAQNWAFFLPYNSKYLKK